MYLAVIIFVINEFKRDVVSVKQTIQKLICKPFFRISVPRIKLGNDHDTKKYHNGSNFLKKQ